MAIVDIGPIRQVYKGNWSKSVTYEKLNTVRHNGALWICKDTCTNHAPFTSSSYWDLISRDGVVYTTIDEFPDNGILTLPGVPICVKLSDDVVYSVQQDDCTAVDDSNWSLDLNSILALMNMDTFTGPWQIYFAYTAETPTPVSFDELSKDEKDALLSSIKGDAGPQGPQGIQGEPGYTPVRGVDFWTAEDQAFIETYIETHIETYVDNKILNGAW